MLDRKLLTNISHAIERDTEENINVRRKIHSNPEIGFDTHETELLVKEKLNSLGISILPSTVGILGLIPGQNHNNIIALRADMDALCLQEETDLPFKSKKENVMHACGHDAHTAILLGVAKLLIEFQEFLYCDILLIFQPAEEGPNLGGARIIQKDLDASGLTDKIKYIFGLHVFNDYPVGTVAYKYGGIMASTDEFKIQVHGIGGHAGQPNKTIDAISVIAKIVGEIESFMAKHIDPFDQAVCSIGVLSGGSAPNIVAERAEINGTIRCLQEETRSTVIHGLENICLGIETLSGAQCKLETVRGLPVTNNDRAATTYVKETLSGNMKEIQLIELTRGSMGAEDFSFYGAKIPASFIHIGSANPDKGATYFAHHPKFTIDEDAISIGIRIFMLLALSLPLEEGI